MMKLKDVFSEQNVVIPGVGQMSLDALKRDTQRKLQDLLQRAQRGEYTGIGKAQFDVLALYWQTLQQHKGSI